MAVVEQQATGPVKEMIGTVGMGQVGIRFAKAKLSSKQKKKV